MTQLCTCCEVQKQMSWGKVRGQSIFSVINVLWNTSLKENTDECIVNWKSISLAKKLQDVTSCCTKSVKFVKVTPIVECLATAAGWTLLWLRHHAAATATYWPAALGSRKTIILLRLLSHLFKNSHRIPTEPIGIQHSFHTHPIFIPMGIPIPTAALAIWQGFLCSFIDMDQLIPTKTGSFEV